jgi:quinol monooxygenase YgiN
MLLVIARYTIAQGNRDRVLSLVAELETTSRGEDGCLAFDAYLKTDSSDVLMLVERYQSPAAFDAHRATPHFARLVLEQIVPLLRERTVESFTVPNP